MTPPTGLQFSKETITARLIDLGGKEIERLIEVRTHPISGRRCRITFSRSLEPERAGETLPPPPPDAGETRSCPFCMPQFQKRTPRLIAALNKQGRMRRGQSILFPNLFPYGAYSAVSLFDNVHYSPIGTASVQSYTDCFINCAHYLETIRSQDPLAVHMAITQNFLPAAGGSLVHPHLQVHADKVASNHHRFLIERAEAYQKAGYGLLFGNYLQSERSGKERYIGRTGIWHWLAAFAPEGFFEIWALQSGKVSLFELSQTDWHQLARGVLNAQRFYRSLNHNSYNLGLLSVENGQRALEIRCVIVVRSNYAPWTRSDHTGYELMLGDMATFTAPEETAAMARPFWND